MTPAQAAKFWSRVDRTDECWTWTAGKTTLGYGVIQFDKRKQYAHRLSYEAVNGPIPDGYNIDHQCHNASCVNPAHLRLATQKQNVENTSIRSDNTSGERGVSWSKCSGKWAAEVHHHGRRIWLGLFPTKADASIAARSKRLELFTHNDADRKSS